MRKRLLDHLTTELESYVKFRATNPLALYIHVPRTPLAYPELAESVFSAPFYLQNLLDIDRFPNYPINDPDRFLNSLMLDLRRLATVLRNNSLTGNSLLRKELPHIHLLLQAQVGHHLLSRLLLSPPLPHLLCIGSFISIVCELFFQPLNFHSFLPCDIHMYQVAGLSMMYHDIPYDMYITWKSVKP